MRKGAWSGGGGVWSGEQGVWSGERRGCRVRVRVRVRVYGSVWLLSYAVVLVSITMTFWTSCVTYSRRRPSTTSSCGCRPTGTSPWASPLWSSLSASCSHSLTVRSKSQNWATLFEDVCLSVAVDDSEVGTSRRPRQGGWDGTGGGVTVGRMSATHDDSPRVSCHMHCTGESIHVCMCAFVVWMCLGDTLSCSQSTQLRSSNPLLLRSEMKAACN